MDSLADLKWGFRTPILEDTNSPTTVRSTEGNNVSTMRMDDEFTERTTLSKG